MRSRNLSRRVGRPYDLFSKIVSPIAIVPKIKKSNAFYHSFGYMNLDDATQYYSKKQSLIHDIMLGLFTVNESIEDASRSEELVRKVVSIADKVAMQGIWDGEGYFFMYDGIYEKFDLRGERYSGIVQGKVASLFMRAYQITGHKQYHNMAKGALMACRKLRVDGGVCLDLPQCKWVEEYASPTPSMVLNGFVFTTIATAEFLSVSKDKDLQKFFEECMAGLVSWLPHFRINEEVLYSMYNWDLCNVHYIGVLRWQFAHLRQLVDHQEVDKFSTFLESKYDDALFRKVLKADTP